MNEWTILGSVAYSLDACCWSQYHLRVEFTSYMKKIWRKQQQHQQQQNRRISWVDLVNETWLSNKAFRTNGLTRESTLLMFLLRSASQLIFGPSRGIFGYFSNEMKILLNSFHEIHISESPSDPSQDSRSVSNRRRRYAARVTSLLMKSSSSIMKSLQMSTVKCLSSLDY